jgi:hypothetical protein
MGMSKHDADVLGILRKDTIMSTNEVLIALEKKTGKTINWHALYHILNELADDHKAEKLKSKAGFFWKRAK